VHSTYGRNRVGGVNWRRDNLAHAMSVTDQDNYYWYDGLQQGTRHDRGNLVPTSGAPYVGIDVATRAQQELFNYDETGNWNAYHDQVPGLNQTRTHTAANEIASIAAPTGVVQPAYDPVGNMTTCPKPGEWDTAFTFKWDAWNRLVEIKQGATVVATNEYDAMTRRTRKISGGETRDYYYNNQWRSIEERVGSDVKEQFVWTPWDRWTLLRRHRSVSGTLDEVFYVAKDYLDPVGLIRADGGNEIVERYGYEAFGPVRIMDEDYDPLTTSAYAWNFLFHAEFRDTDSGLYNYGYRFYHPNLGHWISKDPIGEKGGVNLYAMVENNPIAVSDYLGQIGSPWGPGFGIMPGQWPGPKPVQAPSMWDNLYLLGRFEPTSYDNTKWFEIRMGELIEEYRNKFKSQLDEWVCSNQTDYNGDFDYEVLPAYYDATEFETVAQLGRFNIAIRNIKKEVDTETHMGGLKMKYTAEMYVWDVPGENHLGPLFKERYVERAWWSISGKVCCNSLK
jgi:RHS repeat-associated protein